MPDLNPCVAGQSGPIPSGFDVVLNEMPPESIVSGDFAEGRFRRHDRLKGPGESAIFDPREPVHSLPGFRPQKILSPETQPQNRIGEKSFSFSETKNPLAFPGFQLPA
jgi:hypothetical protein